MNYPQQAWLLLTDENLYLMSSDVDNKYYDKISVKITQKGEPKIEGIPAEWFQQPRNLVVNFDKEEPTPLNN